MGLIAEEGFTTEKIHFALVLDVSGKLIQVLDLREIKGEKKIFRNVVVPQGTKKSVQISANFLWGNTSYVLGADDKGKQERTKQCHKAFRDLHEKLLSKSRDPGAQAVLNFLSSWTSDKAITLNYWEDMLKGNIIFQLEGDRFFIHERPEIKKIWLDTFKNSKTDKKGMCLVSGEIAPIARLHPSIKGVKYAQPSGAALVSFNLDSFCSYNKDQSFNAPVSEAIVSAYTKALNHLLSSNTNRIQIGDATTVFWTERESPLEGFFGMLLDPRDTSSDDKELCVFLETVRDGKLPASIDGDVQFYILGLSPNKSRLSVRFWHVSTVKDISEKIGQHFKDLSMIRSFDSELKYPGIWHLLKETYNQKSKDGVSPLLGGAVMRSILTGIPYPQELLSAVICRIRADQNINYMRAAIIKAVLVRKKRILNQGMEVSMSLDKENKNVAYLLGRLFAVLEKAQQDAIPGANTTIKDRFYGSASATPKIVFPLILRLAQHHIEKSDYGKVRDKQIEEIICNINEFPAHMSLDEQGLFAVGYYHQRQDLFKKKDN